MKTHIEELVGAALQALAGDCIPAERLPERAPIERTRTRTHGDFATNAALMLAKAAGMRPRELAERLIGALPASELIDKVDIAGPGFINFFLTPAAYHRELRTILEAGERYGQSGLGAARKTVVEFVSANPTGPLHVGHGRAAAVGDCLCRLLEATGWEVTSEFYYNDAGRQISNLALSVQARCWGIGPGQEGWPEDGYRGDYIKDIAQAYRAGATAHADDREVTAKADPDDLNAIRQFAVAYLRHEQDLDLHAFKVAFDVYSLESALYTSGEVEATVEKLVAKGHTYEHAGALWLKTSRYGDDKDRVMRKSDGSYTYFLPDVAYHVGKWRRGFQYAINEHGADHHSTSVRVRAGLQALEMGIPPDWPEYVLHQMVTVMRGGAEVKISKRAGGYVTLRDLIDEVGRDATRFFFVLRASEQHLDFDLDLAKSRTHENPVYYIQYAHARVLSVFRQLAERGAQWDQALGERHAERLSAPHEDALLVALSRFPEAVETAAAKRSPHLIAHYLHELANDFHTYYNAETFLVDDDELRNARLNLIQATAQVLKNGLALLGVSAPDSM